MKRAVAAVVLVAAAAGAGYWYYQYTKTPEPPTVATALVTRGDIVETVGATGTLQAVTTVQVGTQVSGTIQSLNADFNSLVRKGQVLARLDPSLFQTQIEQSRANLIRAQADLERLRVALADAQTKLNRARELSARSLIPRTELETAEVNVRSAEAQIRSSEAQVTQAQASLNQTQVNIEHTVITAPIDGLVISRNVDVGQTVAASMQAPTLFVLAADLTKMQVVANLDESDVGRIRPNQPVTFRVDAYPNDTFRGTVSQVRLEPKVQQNVVTYATVIDVPNDGLKLKPGMTANVSVEIARATNVLRIPNAALRFRPTNEIFTALGQAPPEPPARGAFGGGGRGGRAPTDLAPNAGDAGAARAATPAPPAEANPSAKARPAEVARQDTAALERPAPDVPAAPAAEASSPRRRQRGGGTGDSVASPDRSANNSLPGGDQGRGFSPDGRGPGRENGPVDPEERRARLAERMRNLSPEERDAMLARMRARGLEPGGRFAGPGATGDTDAADARRGRGRGAPRDAGSGAAARQPRQRAESQPQALASSGAATIDALFAPLPRVETMGRIWVHVEKQLRPVRLRLGISDGQMTELIEGDLAEGSEVVTSVTIAGQATRPPANQQSPFGQPGRGGFPGGFPGGGFPGAGGGGGNRNGGNRGR